MAMTDNARLILSELKALYPNEVTKQALTARLSDQGIRMPHVTGTINGLLKKKLAVERIEDVPPAGDDKKGKTLRYVVLTEAGLAHDPDEEERVKAEEKEAAKAMKAAAKALPQDE